VTHARGQDDCARAAHPIASCALHRSTVDLVPSRLVCWYTGTGGVWAWVVAHTRMTKKNRTRHTKTHARAALTRHRHSAVPAHEPCAHFSRRTHPAGRRRRRHAGCLSLSYSSRNYGSMRKVDSCTTQHAVTRARHDSCFCNTCSVPALRVPKKLREGILEDSSVAYRPDFARRLPRLLRAAPCASP
jgi:hypothetical protein